MTSSSKEIYEEDLSPTVRFPTVRFPTVRFIVLIDFVAAVGRKLISLINILGEFFIFLAQIVTRSFSPPLHFSLIVRQMYIVGVQSLMVVVLVGIFAGAVLAVQSNYSLAKFGASAFTGSAVALGLIRELGPVLTALMVNGRAGSAMTAELGIMKITEQVDALRSMGVDPLRYLMVPRVVAGVIVVPLLTCIFNVVGILGGYMVCIGNLGLSSGTFMNAMVDSVKDVDVISGLIKSIVFGMTISWVACFYGWRCGLGAEGVNRSTTGAVVTASVIILVTNYFLTSILTQLFP